MVAPNKNTRLSDYAEQSQGMLDQARHQVSEAVEQTTTLVRENPGSSTLVTFAIGFGVGLLATALLSSPPRRRSWWESNLPEWSSRDQINSALSQYLPNSMSRYLH